MTDHSDKELAERDQVAVFRCSQHVGTGRVRKIFSGIAEENFALVTMDEGGREYRCASKDLQKIEVT